MVLFSFRPPNADYLGFPATSEGIVESACKAEDQDFDCCMVNDHILVQDVPDMVTYFANTYDPLMVLSYLAAKTSRIRVGSGGVIGVGCGLARLVHGIGDGPPQTGADVVGRIVAGAQAIPIFLQHFDQEGAR